MPSPKTADELLRQQVGRAVRRRRTDLGLTQAQLGVRVHRDQASISKIEQGDYRALTTAIIIDLAFGLDCAPGDLLDWPFGIMHVAALDEGRPSLASAS
jgi:transcriptional regulator with XRE-family HTH domain